MAVANNSGTERSLLANNRHTEHAESLSYVTIHTRKSELAEDGSVPLDGPNCIQELHDNFVRLADGWHIAEREVMTAFERRPK